MASESLDSNEAWQGGSVAESFVNFNKRQYEEPYRSTVFVSECLKQHLIKTQGLNVLDIGCGAGANLLYLAKTYPEIQFHGLDLNEYYINWAQLEHSKRKIDNTHFHVGDFRTSHFPDEFHIIGSSQVLNIVDLGKGRELLEKSFELAREGVFIFSLFTESKLNFEIVVDDVYSERKVPYNIYSIPRTVALADKYGFRLSEQEKFEIDIDLPRTEDGLGTYTLTMDNGRRLMFSDVLHMPWHFLFFQKR